MGFVKFNDKDHLTNSVGKAVYFCGINYTSGYACTIFGEDWRPEQIEAKTHCRTGSALCPGADNLGILRAKAIPVQ